MKYLILALVSLLAFCSVGAFASEQDETERYLFEFNNSGESCSLLDSFYYQMDAGKFLIFEISKDTVPIFLTCCDNNSNCTSLIFDVKNKEIYSDNRTLELINLNYIRWNLHTENLSETAFISEGVDMCDPFGEKTLNQETANLAFATSEKIEPYLADDLAKTSQGIRKTAKAFGKVGKFNVASFALSITCNHNDKKLNKIIESLATCNLYLENIDYGLTKENMVPELNDCNENSKLLLSEYLNSPISRTKNVVDKGANVISGLFSFFRDLADTSSTDIPELEIKETDYEIAIKINSQLTNQGIYLSNPNQERILLKHNRRINEKQEEVSVKWNELKNKYDNVRDSMPSWFDITFTNLFMYPDHELSESKNSLNIIKQKLESSGELYSEYRFNSALNELDYSGGLLLSAQQNIEQDLAVDRQIDFVLIGVIFSIIILLIIGYKRWMS